VARLLHGGFDNIAVILERPPGASDGWKRAAAALREGMPTFDRLRRLSAATLLPATFAIPAALRGVRVQLDALLGVAHRLGLDAPFDQWHRLVGPAMAWAAATPGLMKATAASLHAAIRAGKVLVPADPQPDTGHLRWVPAQLGHASAQELLRRAASALTETRNAAAALPQVGHFDAAVAEPSARHKAGQARAELQTCCEAAFRHYRRTPETTSTESLDGADRCESRKSAVAGGAPEPPNRREGDPAVSTPSTVWTPSGSRIPSSTGRERSRCRAVRVRPSWTRPATLFTCRPEHRRTRVSGRHRRA
jgi:hypothetical protein